MYFCLGVNKVLVLASCGPFAHRNCQNIRANIWYKLIERSHNYWELLVTCAVIFATLIKYSARLHAHICQKIFCNSKEFLRLLPCCVRLHWNFRTISESGNTPVRICYIYITIHFVSINHFRVCLFSSIQTLLAASAALIPRVSIALHVSCSHDTWDTTSPLYH